jgi:thiamine biosynthesis lipoprotein ApbE
MTRRSVEDKIPALEYRDFRLKKRPSSELRNLLAEQAIRPRTAAAKFAQILESAREFSDKQQGESDVPTDRS